MDNGPNIYSTHQDENDEMATVGLYSHKKCYVSVTPHRHYFITLHYTFGNLSTE